MPGLKKLWFQLHWFVGITAGSVLILIGLSGGVLSFQQELLSALNPGTASVLPVAGRNHLSPPEIAAALRKAGDQHVVQRITVHAEPGRAAQVTFAPLAGQRRGHSQLADPYSGALLPELAGEAFFDWVERLHRWLLLPRDQGKSITGGLAICLLGLSLSGLYLRWPRHPLSWRSWLTFDTALKGRSFLWGLHSVVGTWALAGYVLFTLTGVYWAFDWVRGPVDRWAGTPARQAEASPPGGSRAGRESSSAQTVLPLAAADSAPVWASFIRTSPTWQQAQVRWPDRAGQPVQILWLDVDAPHDRARNQMRIAPDGHVLRDERYADLPIGRRALTTVYPLHTGSYFGMTGRIAMMLISLALPLFAITGWLLYLDRRRKARAVLSERRALAGALSPPFAIDGPKVLVAFASQAGRAERLAVRTVAMLRAAGVDTSLQSVGSMDTEQLRHHQQVLFIASTFGEGDSPDSARRFARLLASDTAASLPHVRYGLLALGDRQYQAFCGFGLALDHQLHRLGAQPLFPMVEMDGEDPLAWGLWQTALMGHFGVPMPGMHDAAVAAPDEGGFHDWTLSTRHLCNPGSQGAPLFSVQLVPPENLPLSWQAGALVEVQPCHAPEVVQACLQREGLDGEQAVQWQGHETSLRAVFVRSVLPTPGAASDGVSAQDLVDGMRAMALRSYSMASLPNDGHVQLLVRQARHDGGLGVASGWLTAHAVPGTRVRLRVVTNMAFASDGRDVPAIFIGNGSGYAGLRAHLIERMQQGFHRNWLLFGERQRAHDGFVEAEVQSWLAMGKLERADFVYSRDQAPRRYVQDALKESADTLCAWVADGAVLYVCGSLQGMAAGVDAALQAVLGATVVEDLIAQGRYRRDVY